jgi:hypothetical protein
VEVLDIGSYAIVARITHTVSMATNAQASRNDLRRWYRAHLRFANSSCDKPSACRFADSPCQDLSTQILAAPIGIGSPWRTHVVHPVRDLKGPRFYQPRVQQGLRLERVPLRRHACRDSNATILAT